LPDELVLADDIPFCIREVPPKLMTATVSLELLLTVCKGLPSSSARLPGGSMPEIALWLIGLEPDP